MINVSNCRWLNKVNCFIKPPRGSGGGREEAQKEEEDRCFPSRDREMEKGKKMEGREIGKQTCGNRSGKTPAGVVPSLIIDRADACT